MAVAPLIDLLLLTAALRSSLSAVARRFAFGFSHETARRALGANLPPVDALADGLVGAPHGYLPRALFRRRRDVAVGLHYVPYYGAAGAAAGARPLAAGGVRLRGVTPGAAARRARFYRAPNAKRFGIETSYRQMNEGKGRTTTRDGRRRLLWPGLALLLRRAWVWLPYRVAPRGTNRRSRRPDAALRRAALSERPAERPKGRHPTHRHIPPPQPLEIPFPASVAG